MNSENQPSGLHSTTVATRRDFIGTSVVTIGTLLSSAGKILAQAGSGTTSKPALDLAEWSYFWLGVERAKLARGTVVNGT